MHAGVNACGFSSICSLGRVTLRALQWRGCSCCEALLRAAELCAAVQAPDDAADRILALMESSRDGPALDFSRKMDHGIGIVVYNAALNALCNLGCDAALRPGT